MADRSPAFNPPTNSLPADNDPQIVKVNLKNTDWAARKSQIPSGGMAAEGQAISHVKSGS
jgi:hypothetical protein